jgi:hypothetical protein
VTEVTSGIKAHVRHLRAEKICMAGARTWYKHHGLSFPQLLKDGTPVEELEATGDKMALDVARRARDEA